MSTENYVVIMMIDDDVIYHTEDFAAGGRYLISVAFQSYSLLMEVNRN